MMQKAWCSIEEAPSCFSRSSIKFQGHMDWKINDLNPVWVRLLDRSQLSNPSDLPVYVRIRICIWKTPLSISEIWFLMFLIGNWISVFTNAIENDFFLISKMLLFYIKNIFYSGVHLCQKQFEYQSCTYYYFGKVRALKISSVKVVDRFHNIVIQNTMLKCKGDVILHINTLRQRQNGCHFADIFKWIFVDEIHRILKINQHWVWSCL